jgi:hypothetical protein
MLYNSGERSITERQGWAGDWSNCRLANDYSLGKNWLTLNKFLNFEKLTTLGFEVEFSILS